MDKLTVVLATLNKSKMAEINAIFANTFINLIMLSDHTSDDVPETGATFVENALIKARYASEKLGMPAIADDSGLVVPALNGEPGIYSARYANGAKEASAHYSKLLSKMKDVPDNNRRAFMHCTLVYISSPTDPSPLIAQGNWQGYITHKPMGNEGFGYDPVFWLPNENKTAAELTLNEKNQQSHRYLALMQLKKLMAENVCLPYLSTT